MFLKAAKGAVLIKDDGSGKGVEWEREEPRGGWELMGLSSMCTEHLQQAGVSSS